MVKPVVTVPFSGRIVVLPGEKPPRSYTHDSRGPVGEFHRKLLAKMKSRKKRHVIRPVDFELWHKTIYLYQSGPLDELWRTKPKLPKSPTGKAEVTTVGPKSKQSCKVKKKLSVKEKKKKTDRINGQTVVTPALPSGEVDDLVSSAKVPPAGRFDTDKSYHTKARSPPVL